MKTTMQPQAFGLIDALRCFMPEAEGARLEMKGFGELPIPAGETIVPFVNQLLARYALIHAPIAIIKEAHPEQTAHFSSQPNFTTTWPVHGVANTPGAELHPDIVVPKTATLFDKGKEALVRGEDDNSYSAYNSATEHGETFHDWLRDHGITSIALAGLALDYCVGLTAIDLREKADLEVTVITDATRPVTEETGAVMLERFREMGIRTATTKEILRLAQVQ